MLMEAYIIKYSQMYYDQPKKSYYKSNKLSITGTPALCIDYFVPE